MTSSIETFRVYVKNPGHQARELDSVQDTHASGAAQQALDESVQLGALIIVINDRDVLWVFQARMGVSTEEDVTHGLPVAPVLVEDGG